MTAKTGLLEGLVGEWEGISRTWFQPGPPADEAPIRARVRRIGDTPFVLHEYAGTFGGQPREGVEIIGLDLDAEGGAFVSAWVDTFHMATDVMVSRGGPAGGGFLVLGSFPDGAGGPPWGWRTHVELAGPDRLLITAYIITPAGQEMKAVETEYTRRER